MRLHVLVAFRNRADLLDRCLQSIAEQTDHDFAVIVADDASDEAAVDDVLAAWVLDQPHDGWFTFRRPERLGTLHNQVDAIRSVPMAADDVIVFVDGDDRLAHPGALERVRAEYQSGPVELTYGSYQPDPPSSTCPAVRPIPADVCRRRGGYRQWARRNGTVWNHLRTMRRRIFDAIPVSYFVRDGDWLQTCPDHALMTPALELAGGRHRMIDDTLLLYTSDRPDAEWRVGSEVELRNYPWVMSRPPLRPLPRTQKG